MKLNWTPNKETSGYTAEFAGGKVFDIVPSGPVWDTPYLWRTFYQRGPRRLLISSDVRLADAQQVAEEIAGTLTAFTATNPGRESNHA